MVTSLANPFYIGKGWKVSVSIENNTFVKEYFGLGYNYRITNDTNNYELVEIWIKSGNNVKNLSINDFSRILESYVEHNWIKVPYSYHIYKENEAGTIGFFELTYSQQRYDHFNLSSDLFRIKTDKGILKPLIYPGFLRVVLPKYNQIIRKSDGEISKQFERYIIEWHDFQFASVTFLHPQKAIEDASNLINETYKAIENAKKDECLISNVLKLEKRFFIAENLTRKAKIAYFNGSYEKSVNLALKSKEELKKVQNELKLVEKVREKRKVQTTFLGFLIVFLAIICFFLTKGIS